MVTKVKTVLDVRLYHEPPSTVRTWLLLENIGVSEGRSFLSTISELSETTRPREGCDSASSSRPISRASISKALKKLEELELIACQRVGHAVQISLPEVA